MISMDYTYIITLKIVYEIFNDISILVGVL